jgi:hypothetical protein
LLLFGKGRLFHGDADSFFVFIESTSSFLSVSFKTQEEEMRPIKQPQGYTTITNTIAPSK